MKKAIPLVLLFAFLAICSFSEPLSPDSVNRYDSKGKREGWHIEYLDTAFKCVQKEQSYYYRFTFFIKGASYDPVWLPVGGHVRSEAKTAMPAKGDPILLNGRYIIVQSNGKWQDEVEYDNGIRSGIHKSYRNGRLRVEIDYTKKFKPEQEFSYYYTEYKENGKVFWSGFFLHGEKKCYEGEYYLLMPGSHRAITFTPWNFSGLARQNLDFPLVATPCTCPNE